MKARCPRCGCEFAAGGYSEWGAAVQMMITSLIGVGIGVLLALLYFFTMA